MKKIGRNDLCWCGSGNKYKHCHLNRSNEDKPGINELETLTKKIFSQKKCYHPESPAGCNGKIIKAHSIQKSRNMSKISRNGKVYTLKPNLVQLIKTSGNIVETTSGINDASTFYGFCQYHDMTLFSPVENSNFVPCDEHCFLLGYRSLCKEYHSKQAQYELSMKLKEKDKGIPRELQFIYQELCAIHSTGAAAGARDMTKNKKCYDGDLLSRSFSNYRYLALKFNSIPQILCSAHFTPSYDFNGDLLQRLENLDEYTQSISMTILAVDNFGYAVFHWNKDSDKVITKILIQLLSFRKQQYSSIIAEMAFLCSDNVVMSPDWWDELAGDVKEHLLSCMNDNIWEPMSLKKVQYRLSPAVDWNVCAIYSNFFPLYQKTL